MKNSTHRTRSRTSDCHDLAVLSSPRRRCLAAQEGHRGARKRPQNRTTGSCYPFKHPTSLPPHGFSGPQQAKVLRTLLLVTVPTQIAWNCLWPNPSSGYYRRQTKRPLQGKIGLAVKGLYCARSSSGGRRRPCGSCQCGCGSR